MASKSCFICSKAEQCSLCDVCLTTHYCSFHRINHTNGKLCFPVALVQTPVVGRCLIAARDISAGELLLEDVAVAYGPKEEPQIACIMCLTSLQQDNNFCSQCKLYLCSNSVCRAQHSPECSFFAGLFSPNSSVSQRLAAVAPLRLTQRMNMDSAVRRSLDLLMDHRQDRQLSNDEHWQRSTQLVEKFGGDYKHDFERCIGLLYTNALNIDEGAGRAIFPTFSFLSHSCANNSKHVVERSADGRYKIRLYSQRNIRKGSEVTISYINLLRSGRERRANLKSQWHFDCTCERCLNPPRLDQELSATLCPHCRKGFLLDSYSDTEDHIICTYCSSQVPIEMVQKVIWFMQDKLNNSPKSIEALEKLLEYFLQFLHKNHFLVLICKRILTQLYQEDNPDHLDKKLTLSTNMVEIFTQLDPGLSKSRGLAYIQLARARLCKNTLLGNLSIAQKESQEFLHIIKDCLSIELKSSLAGKSLAKFQSEVDSLLHEI